MSHLRAATRRVRLASDEWRAWLLAYTALAGLTFGTAALVWVVSGGPTLAHGLLRLTLTAAHNPPPSVANVISIAANNTPHSVWPLSLGLLDAQRRRATRMLGDALVTANLAVPGVLVGAALATYTTRVLPYLPHVPLEFVGIATGAGGWIVERARPLTPRARILCVGATVVALMVAATIETCLVPHQ